MRTIARNAAVALVSAGLLATASRWVSVDTEPRGLRRDRYAGPERTFDDRQRHTVHLAVRYRPARQLDITWGIGSDGGRDQRMPGDRAAWEVTRTNVPDGTHVTLSADNFDRGGYLYCVVEEDDTPQVEHLSENGDHRDYCELDYVVGGKSK